MHAPKPHTRMFIVAVFLTAKKMECIKCLTVELESQNRIQYSNEQEQSITIHSMEESHRQKKHTCLQSQPSNDSINKKSRTGKTTLSGRKSGQWLLSGEE